MRVQGRGINQPDVTAELSKLCRFSGVLLSGCNYLDSKELEPVTIPSEAFKIDPKSTTFKT